MTNFAQERFNLGVKAAYLLNEVRDITLHSGPAIEHEYERRANDDPDVDTSLRTLNRLYREHNEAWDNYHIYKAIADTVFGSFVYDRTSNSGLDDEEHKKEIAALMSGVNGFPEIVRYPFIEDMDDSKEAAA